MKKLLLVGVVGLSALLGGCSSVVEFTQEPPRQSYAGQVEVDKPYYGNSDMAVKAGTGRSGKPSRGQAGAPGNPR